jgi:hypothetical protein
MLTQEELKDKLIYDQDNGMFIWKSSIRKSKINTIAGTGNKKGYIQIAIYSKLYFAHKLAWLYMTGSFPKNDLDHIDGNPQNNAFNNLREATRSQNCMNRKISSLNTTGFKGVSFNKSTGKFIAQLKVNGIYKYLGCFNTAEEASNSYNENARILFGEFHRETT